MFAIVLFFLLLIPFILFGVVEVQKMFFYNKFILLAFGVLWILAMVFWALNFWTIASPIPEPYFLVEL